MKRRWFQIHLSTAIVMMMFSAVFIWQNVRRFERSMESLHYGMAELGWPYCFARREWNIEYDLTDSGQTISFCDHDSGWYWNYETDIAAEALSLDGLILIGINLAVIFGSKLVIRLERGRLP